MDNKIAYVCNTLPNFWRSIYLTVTIGMGTTFGLIALGIPATATPFIFFIVLFGTLCFFLKKSGFEMTEEGITEIMMPYLEIIPGKPVIKKYPWSQIKRYLLDENWNRAWGMQKHLKINFPGYQMSIWEGKTPSDKAAFDRLTQYFLAHVPQQKAKKSFYDTWFAKALALFFTGITMVFIVLAALGMLPATSLVKLGIVLIPGCILFLNRVFRKKSDK